MGAREDLIECYKDRMEHMRGTGNKYIELADQVSGLSKVLQRVIHVQSEAGREYNQRQGRIASRSLWKVATNRDDIFYQRTAPRITKDCCFTFLGDCSGSMHGKRYDTMAASMIAANRALKSIGVPFELLGFTQAGHFAGLCPVHLVWKDYAEQSVSDKDLAKMLAITERYLNQNADGEAVLWAYRRILRQQKKKKILVVISDGQPCCDARGDAANYLRQVTTSIEKEGRVKLYAIGIQTTSVKEFYKDHVVIDNVSSLPEVFLNLVKGAIV